MNLLVLSLTIIHQANSQNLVNYDSMAQYMSL